MLLSYYKGGLITENNVFVFSSAVLVTQCYVRANLQRCCTHERHQVPAADSVRALQVRQDRTGAQPKFGTDQKLDWSLTCSECTLVFLEMRNGAELSNFPPRCVNSAKSSALYLIEFGLIPQFKF